MASSYEKELRKQKAGAGLQGAGIGASTGASIGTAIYPGLGTLIGAGVGALGGGIIGAATYKGDPLQEAQMKELEDLQYRQKMNMLGLSDAERAQLEAALIDPMRAARREQQQVFSQAIAGGDVSGGAIQKAAIGAEDRAALQEGEARAKIEELNLQRIKEEEARIYELLGDEEARQQALREANMQSISSFGETAMGVADQYAARAERDAFAEQEDYLLQQLQEGSPEEQEAAREALEFYKEFYGQ